MATKKCPKCGEENPAEAVMCWACYTPLSGGSALGGGGSMAMASSGLMGQGASGQGMGARAATPISVQDDEKKKIDPKLIGVVGFLLLAAVGGGVAMTMMGGQPEDSSATINKPADPGATTSNIPPQPGGVAPAPLGSPQGPSVAPGGAPAPQVAAPMPFTTVVPPNPQYATGTMGILAPGRNLTKQQAASLARFARDQFKRSGRWTSMQICVFSDNETAQAFATYQNKRRGAPLGPGDYQQLRSIWPRTPAFYEQKGRSERYYYPSDSPSNWWASS